MIIGRWLDNAMRGFAVKIPVCADQKGFSKAILDKRTEKRIWKHETASFISKSPRSHLSGSREEIFLILFHISLDWQSRNVKGFPDCAFFGF
jgi:hypothetical protein